MLNEHLTGWRRPEVLLLVMAAAWGLSVAVWMSLINNFAVERAAFDGADMGVLQSAREVPGFLAFTFVALLIFMREQTIAVISLLLLGAGVVATGFFPNFLGLMVTTIIMSVGFHYHETATQSLALQWSSRDQAPVLLGRMLSATSVASIVAFGLVWAGLELLELDFAIIYAVGGGATVAAAILVHKLFPRMAVDNDQRRELFLRRRYWLFYVLTFINGARRQIFVVFAAFLMVEKFGLSAANLTLLLLVNHIINTFLAPKIGQFIMRFGERRAMTLEYVGLIGVFIAYALVENVWIAGGLYILDHIFFSMAIALHTYFGKIADPRDIAPTAGISFSINHIAAVIIPAAFGLIWLVNPAAVFYAGAGMAVVSLLLSQLIPRNPDQGNETVWSNPVPRPAAAE
ncbi:MAG: MFS transporter [Alphaproteobacteria bacterium]|nr:MFS transporter [Alphaproteobacteria bacterium]